MTYIGYKIECLRLIENNNKIIKMEVFLLFMIFIHFYYTERLKEK